MGAILTDEQVALIRFVVSQREREVVLHWPGRAFATLKPFNGAHLVLRVDPAVDPFDLEEDPFAPPKRRVVFMTPHELSWGGKSVYVYVYALSDSDYERIAEAAVRVFCDFNLWADRPWWGATVLAALERLEGSAVAS